LVHFWTKKHLITQFLSRNFTKKNSVVFQLNRNTIFNNRLDKLDAKIDATMKVKKMDVGLKTTVLPIGYVCVAIFSGDEK